MTRSRSTGEIELCRAALGGLPDAVSTPRFDTARLSPGIVHLGLGGFHRAHMARYMHELMERDEAARSWGIIGAGLMRGDGPLIAGLEAQDRLYTLVERDGGTERARVIGSLAGVIDAGQSTAVLLDALADARIRIVSLTVTENGYCLNAATKRLDPAHVLVQADLANPRLPRSAIGVLVEALRRRQVAGTAAPTLLSCDNIQHNGRVLRQALADHATLHDERLAHWIEGNVSFPNTMVDRITPVTTDADRDALAASYHVRDRWPVVCETFSQWVIEDRFTLGRPAWENVGAQFIEDVAPYEFMKLRLLNASHLTVAGLGQLAGYVTIDQSLADIRIRSVMAALMDRETGPTLPPVPGINLPDYKRTLLARFANPAIRDTNQRVNTDAPVNVLIDPIRDRLAAGQSVEMLALALAAWLRRVAGHDERGAPIVVTHPQAELLRRKAREGGSDPAALLSISTIFGTLGSAAGLVQPLRRWLAMLYDRGISATLDQAALLCDPPRPA